MHITFLGTSHGVPEPNRGCSCTMIEAGGRRYLIDAGTDPTPKLISRGISPTEISAVFLTHMHNDHSDGLIPFLALCSWYYKTAKPEIYVPEDGVKEAVSAWFRVTHIELPERIAIRRYSEGPIYDDGVLRVTALRTGHIAESFAFVLEAEGKTVLFSGDMKYLDGPETDFARFVEKYPKLDLAVGESAHFEADLYLPALQAHPPKQFVLNHYSWRYAESCWRLRNQLLDVLPVTLATDGHEIDV